VCSVLQTSAGVNGGHLSRISAQSSPERELSPSLWHSLDVWRCVVQLGGGLEFAVQSLAICGSQLRSSSWYCYITTDAL